MKPAPVHTPVQPEEAPLRARVVGEPSDAGLESLAKLLLGRIPKRPALKVVREEEADADR